MVSHTVCGILRHSSHNTQGGCDEFGNVSGHGERASAEESKGRQKGTNV